MLMSVPVTPVWMEEHVLMAIIIPDTGVHAHRSLQEKIVNPVSH